MNTYLFKNEKKKQLCTWCPSPSTNSLTEENEKKGTFVHFLICYPRMSTKVIFVVKNLREKCKFSTQISQCQFFPFKSTFCFFEHFFP